MNVSRHVDARTCAVANYVSSILHKLQSADREEAARRAREAGLSPKRLAEELTTRPG